MERTSSFSVILKSQNTCSLYSTDMEISRIQNKAPSPPILFPRGNKYEQWGCPFSTFVFFLLWDLMMNFKCWKARVTGIMTSKTLTGFCRSVQTRVGQEEPGANGLCQGAHRWWEIFTWVVAKAPGWVEGLECLSHSLSQRHELWVTLH